MTKIEYRVCRCILNDLYIYLVWNNSSMNLNHNDSCHFYKLMKCPYMRTKLRHINNIIFYKEEQNLTILFLKSCYAWISYKERSSLQMLLFLVMKCRNSWTRQQAKWKGVKWKPSILWNTCCSCWPTLTVIMKKHRGNNTFVRRSHPENINCLTLQRFQKSKHVYYHSIVFSPLLK